MIIKELKLDRKYLYWFEKDKVFLFIILLFSICNVLEGQAPAPKTIDSIRQVAAAMPDGIPKFELLDELALNIREVDVNMAFAIHKEAAKAIEKTNAPDKKIESVYSLGVIQMSAGNLKEAKDNMEMVLSYVNEKKVNLFHIKSAAYNILGTIYGFEERYIEAIENFNKALNYTKDPVKRIDIELNLGTVYYDMGLGSKALEIFLPSIKSLEQTANDPYSTEQLVAFYINTAATYLLMKDPQRCLEYCQKVLHTQEKGNLKNAMYIAQTYANLGNAYTELKSPDSSLVYYNQAADLLKKIDAPIQLIYALLNIEQTQVQMKNFDAALKTIQEAWSVQSTVNLEETNYAILLSLAMVVLDAKKAGYAEQKFMPSLKELGFENLTDLFSKLDPQHLSIEMPTTRQKAYKALSDFYKSQSSWEKAYYYQELYTTVTDSIFLLEKEKIAANLTFQYDVEKKEKQLALQQKNIVELENERGQRQKWLLGLALLICVLAMVVFYINNQRKQEQKEKEFLKKEEELAKVQLENTKLVLEQKKQELVLFTQTLVQKNELIQELEGMVQNLDIQQQALQQQKIQQLHQQTILTEEDWENFKQLFSEVHTSFLKEVQLAFPSLTQAEIRLFMLLKLDFSVQHIAGLLGISADSVHKTKYRLRKRLELESNKDLKTFIQNFGEES